ncbi:MAG: hypothetical protein D6736_07465 [Nitrospinota bacterium]|nr:MAG: hypothetical protein D6736_07465 [Nitrospinota bacterium]
MYKDFYGLTEQPFNITPDSKFLYWSPKHQDAFRHLVYSIQNKKGLILLTGEVGTGKTTVLNAVVEHFKALDPQNRVAFLVHSKLKESDLFRYIFSEFGLEVQRQVKSEYIVTLRNFLLQNREERRYILLIVDEAQNFSRSLLEEIRLISNIETPKEKLIQIILAGQPQLRKIIDSPALYQLKQRIGISYNILPLNYLETRSYIQKRLQIAGAKEEPLFLPEAMEAVYHYSGGIPRVINILCDNALLFGCATQQAQIGPAIIAQVAESMHLRQKKVLQPAATTEPSPPQPPEPVDSFIIHQARGDMDRAARRIKRGATRRIKRKGSYWYLLPLGVIPLVLFLAWLFLSPGAASMRDQGRQIMHSLQTAFSGWFALTRTDPPPSTPSPITPKEESPQEVVQERPLPQPVDVPPAGQGEVVDPVVETLTPAGAIPTSAASGDAPADEALPWPASAPAREASPLPEGGRIKKVVTVQEGDTLTDILLREYGEYDATLLDLIERVNPQIVDINLITVGQQIRLPER